MYFVSIRFFSVALFVLYVFVVVVACVFFFCREGTGKAEEPWVHAAEAWWFLRSFVLREDLSLDYDVGGLGVSATFFIVLASFVVAIAQVCSVVVRSVGRSVAVRGARHRRGGVRCRGLVWLGYRASVAHEVYGQP